MLPVGVAAVKPANTIFGAPLQQASGRTVWQVPEFTTSPLGWSTVAKNDVLVVV
jgi:hypothetical protein